MDQITLNVKRERSFVGGAMTYLVKVDDREVGKLRIGQDLSLTIPKHPVTLKVWMIGNGFTFHKLEKSVVLHPEKCQRGIITCTIETKSDTLGVISMGLLKPVGNINIEVDYR